MSTKLDINIKTLPKPPKTIVFGADGFIGRHFLNAYQKFYPDVIGTSHKGSPGKFRFDLLHPDISDLHLKEKGYSHALIAAGITSVARCEKEKEYTRSVNVSGTLELARQLSMAGLRIIWFSSDYVFDGRSGNYVEDSPVNPVNEYGRQKAEVEAHLLQNFKENAMVIRLSKVFGEKRGDGTLFDEMMHKLCQGIPLKAASDQIFCPTSISDVVRHLIRLQILLEKGILHLCNPHSFSRYGLSKKVAIKLGLSEDLIKPINLNELQEDINRPRNTNMVCKKLDNLGLVEFKLIDVCISELAVKYQQH